MEKLHDRFLIAGQLVPKEGQRDLLCSNDESIRCPSFGISDEILLDHLAKILVEAYLVNKKYERNEQQ